MSKTKKALLLVLALTTAATIFAACGKDKGNDETSSGSEYSSNVSDSLESEGGDASSEEEISTSEEDSSSEEEDSSSQEQQTFSVNFVSDVDGAILSHAFEYTEGDEVEIVIVLDEIYTQSLKNLTVTYTLAGGEPVAVTLDEYDSFIVPEASGDITVNVSGIAVNQYKVAFYNGEEEISSVMVTHGEKLTEEQLNTALNGIAKEGQEAWGWQEAVDGAILTETNIHASIATGISSAEELAAIEQNGNYFLTGDIDFTGKEMIKYKNEDNHFTGYQGIIDGRNYKITATGGDLYDSAILFWRLDHATIKNATFDFNFNGLTAFRSGALCRQFVSSTLQNVTFNVSYAQIGQAAVIGTFYGGSVEDCVIYVKSPAYDTIKDGIAALASSVEIGNWSDMDSSVKNLTVHLPANMEGNAVLVSDFVCVNNQAATDETKLFNYTEENVVYAYDMEDGVAYQWENSVIIPASMVVSSEEVPMDYTQAYEGVFAKKVWEDSVDYMWNYEPPFSTDETDISCYRAIRFAIKTDATSKEIVLGSNEIGELDGIGTEWSEIVLKRNAKNSWNIYKDGEEKVRNVALDDLSEMFSRKGVKNMDVNEFSIYLTNVQIIGKEGAEWPDPDNPTASYFGENLGSATKDGAEMDQITPKGYETVYGVDFAAGDTSWMFADMNIANYSLLKFKAKATTGVYIGVDGGSYVGISTDWREVILTNNNDGSWAVTLDGYNDKFTARASNLKDVFVWTLWANEAGTLYTTEIRGEERVVAESGLADFGSVILGNALASGVKQEETFDGVAVYKASIDTVSGGQFGSNFDISAYDEIRFDFKHTGFGGTSFIGGNIAQIAVTSDVWYYVSLQKVDSVWNIYMKTDPTGAFTSPYGEGGRPGDLDYANLANILSFYNWGEMKGDIYVTELRGVASVVTPEPDPEPDPEVPETPTLFGANLGSAVKSGTEVEELAPEGYEKVYGEAFNQVDTAYLFAEIDISGYSQLKFKAKGSVGTYLGNMAGYIGLGTDWREVILTNNNDGTFTVTVDGYGDTFTRTATTLKDMFEFTMWQSEAGTLYTTELRGVASVVTPEPDPEVPETPTLFGANLGSAVKSGTEVEELAPEGYEKVYGEAFNQVDTAYLFAEIDISGYSQLKFKAKGSVGTYLGNMAGYIGLGTDWREVILTNNNDGTFTVTVDGYGDTFTRTATTLKDMFEFTMWQSEAGTLYTTELRGVAKV